MVKCKLLKGYMFINSKDQLILSDLDEGCSQFDNEAWVSLDALLHVVCVTGKHCYQHEKTLF